MGEEEPTESYRVIRAEPNPEFWTRIGQCPYCHKKAELPTFPETFNFEWDGGVKATYRLDKGVYAPIQDPCKSVFIRFDGYEGRKTIDKLFERNDDNILN